MVAAKSLAHPVPSWRSHRPAEDPDKLKRWGIITAKPSEYLVHVRRGRVLEHSSGQGASCFKWPWDAVAVVPTSIQRLAFSADQVTTEKVGVEVKGLAVYRITDPLLAYRLLNFSFPERAQEKLEETLTGMFIGSTRRLVANLSVEDCLTKRKSALAEELLKEVAPVVGGRGRPDDPTHQGWGVVIDTIEIQEVRILSERVFRDLQAPYRSAIEEKAKAAEEGARRALTEQEIEGERLLDQKRHQAAQAELEAEAEREVQKAALEAKKAEAWIETSAVEAQRRAVEVDAERERARAAAELRRIAAEAEREAGELTLEIERKKTELQRVRLEAEAKLKAMERLPDLAAAMGQRIESVRIQQFGEAPDSTMGLAQTVSALRQVVKAAWDDGGGE